MSDQEPSDEVAEGATGADDATVDKEEERDCDEPF